MRRLDFLLTIFFIVSLVSYIIITIEYYTGVFNFPIKQFDIINKIILCAHPGIGSLMLISYTFICYKIIKTVSYDKEEIPKDYYWLFLICSSIIIVSCLLIYSSLKPIGLEKYIEEDLLAQEEKIFIIILGFITLSLLILAYISFVKLWTLSLKGFFILFIGISCIIYFFPFVCNYTIITYKYNDLIWNYYFVLLQLPCLFLLLVFIIMIISLMGKIIDKDVWISAFIGLIILISVGVIFGFLYYERDFALSNTKGELPGFAQYTQPSKLFFEQKYYQKENDLQPLHPEIENYINSEEMGTYKTKSGFLKAIKENCSNIGENIFSNQYVSNWHDICYYRIPFELGKAVIENEFKEKHISKYTNSKSASNNKNSQKIENFTEKTSFTKMDDFIKDIEAVYKKEELKHEEVNLILILIGRADSIPIKIMGKKYNSNYELGLARAERVKKKILDEINIINSDQIVLTSVSYDTEKEERYLSIGDYRETIVIVKSKYNLKKLVDEGDKNKKSSHSITLLDALFYSSYSITTTGYGIIPLDRWIKLLTFIENIFEALIIAGIIGSIANERERKTN